VSPILGILASSYRAAAATSFESIATVTVGSGGAADVEFTSIPGTYKHLQVRILGRTNRSDQNGDFFQTTFNSDTGSNYSWHFLKGDGSSASAIAGANQSMMESNRVPGSLITASVFGAIVIDILDYTDTNKYTTIRSLGGFDGNGSGEIYLNSGSWRNTNAVTSIKFTNSGSRTIQQYSHFALYGIKGVA
jgi:hypothetical protein